VCLLPDGEELTEGRKVMLLAGYDHYQNFHKDESQWVELCLICRVKQEQEQEKQ